MQEECKKCSKCGYKRTPSDTAPVYRCPKCGSIYDEKTEPAPKKEPAAVEKSASPADLICKTCGTYGNYELKRQGNGVIEVFLYFAFFVPGFFYSYWRSQKQSARCSVCNSTEMIPIGSPAGTLLLKSTHPDVKIMAAAEQKSASSIGFFQMLFIILVVIPIFVAMIAGSW